MKTAIKISVLSNLVLFGCLCWLLVMVKGVKPVADSPHGNPPDTGRGATAAAVPPVAPEHDPVPKSFQWNQLYGGNYRAYVTNLRAIGCPEPTLRAIVAADVHAVIQRRADELEKQLADLADGSWSSQLAGWSTNQALKAELACLPDQEAAMLLDCLGGKPASSSPPSIAPGKGEAPAGRPIRIPLIAQPVDLAGLNLNAGQLQAIADLRETFMAKIGGAGQDPNDPAYQARWRAAQTEADDLVKGMIGDQAYQDYQIQALAQAQSRR
jgi:hypothetical protein